MLNDTTSPVNDCCFTLFSREIDESLIPDSLNNPFELVIPAICDIAAEEVQNFIVENESDWLHDFGATDGYSTCACTKGKGKMFGVLVVRNEAGELGYLFTFSGKLTGEHHHHKFVPSLFDISTDDFFMNRGMSELSDIGNTIKSLDDAQEIARLKELRRCKSVSLQQQLFDCYVFLNRERESKSLCSIFEDFLSKRPPSGAGECAAPKLLQYAFKNNMQALAIAEFWWGKTSKSGDRVHKNFYPACNEKCLPILTYMLGERLK